MVDLNEMIIAQLKERDATFPNVNKGILVPMVCILIVSCLIFLIACTIVNLAAYFLFFLEQLGSNIFLLSGSQ
jgi:hypothetical protein